MVDRSEQGIQRRVTGHHDLRLDGIGDLVCRAGGASVFDVGCNRGMAGYEFACNGARIVHGCDNYELGITVAREIFADKRQVSSRFEVLDLTGGAQAIRAAFGRDADKPYDIVLLLAVMHKLARVMPKDKLTELADYFAVVAGRYIGWRGWEEKDFLDSIFKRRGFKLIQYSEISETICPAAIWRRA